MIKKLLWMGLAGGMMMGVVGCGGEGAAITPAKRLVGTWEKGCHKPADNPYARYRTEKWVFRNDNTGSYEKVKYADATCTQNPERFEMRLLSYKVGDTTTDSEGEEAYKLDLVKDWGMGPHEDYTMFRFSEDGNLLIAGYSEDHPGDDDASRENWIDPSWNGYAQSMATQTGAGSAVKPQIYGNGYMYIYRHINTNSDFAKNLLKRTDNRSGWINVAVTVDVQCTDYQYTEADLISSFSAGMVTTSTYMRNDGSCVEQLFEEGHPYQGTGSIVQSAEGR